MHKNCLVEELFRASAADWEKKKWQESVIQLGRILAFGGYYFRDNKGEPNVDGIETLLCSKERSNDLIMQMGLLAQLLTDSTVTDDKINELWKPAQEWIATNKLKTRLTNLAEFIPVSVCKQLRDRVVEKKMMKSWPVRKMKVQ